MNIRLVSELLKCLIANLAASISSFRNNSLRPNVLLILRPKNKYSFGEEQVHTFK